MKTSFSGVALGTQCTPDYPTFPAGTVRASLGYFNTLEDVEALIRAVKEICRMKG